jgi:transposase
MAEDLIGIYTHWQAGRSERQIAESLGLARNTVAKYLEPVKQAGLGRAGPVKSREQWMELASGWFPELGKAPGRATTWPQFDAYREWIAAQLTAGVQASVVYQRLRDTKGVAASLSSLRRWIDVNLPDAAPGRQTATGLMPLTGPGEVAQVDYGFMGRWADPFTGKTLNVNAFIMTLPYSKLPFVYPVSKMDQAAWSLAHVAAFGFYGAVPRRIVPDNLKTGVAKASLYDPQINRAYRELADYYGTLIDPARVRAPKDKSFVERMVQYVRGSWWRGRDFGSLEQMRVDAEAWCRGVAGERSPRALDGRTVNDVFRQVELPAMLGSPVRPFEVAVWVQGKIGRDCHVRIDGCLYSLPFRLVGEVVDARVAGSVVEFYAAGESVKTHPKGVKGKRVTDVGDYPPQQAAFLVRDVAWCKQRARRIGPATSAVVEALMEPYALHKLRSCQGIAHLADKHGPGAVEAACAGALAVGDPTYRTVKGLIEHPMPDLAAGGRQDGGLLRGRDAFVQDEFGW